MSEFQLLCQAIVWTVCPVPVCRRHAVLFHCLIEVLTFHCSVKENKRVVTVVLLVLTLKQHLDNWVYKRAGVSLVQHLHTGRLKPRADSEEQEEKRNLPKVCFHFFSPPFSSALFSLTFVSASSDVSFPRLSLLQTIIMKLLTVSLLVCAMMALNTAAAGEY